jgi:predicted DNA-binding transcriptional regulator AlpA
MKKNKFQDLFLFELAKVPIVQVACEKTALSRNTVYRWRKDDTNFANKMDKALVDGVALVNDMSESQLLTLIKEKNFPAVRFWLNKRHPAYRDKLEVMRTQQIDELTPEQEATVRQALEMARIIPSKKHDHDKQ